MRIACCVKLVPDTTVPVTLTEDGVLVAEGLMREANAADLAAVEQAVRLKEEGVADEVVVVSLGKEEALVGLRQGLAIGADRGVLLADSAFDGGDAIATARVLAAALRQLECDLILCGAQTPDAGEPEVPVMVAELLGWPQVSGAMKLTVESAAAAVVVARRLEWGDREVVRCPLPALLTIEPGIGEPRYASLPVMLAALDAPIVVQDRSALGLPAGEVGAKGSLTSGATYSLPRPRPKKIAMPDAGLSAAERMRMMMSGGLARTKDSSVVEGAPDALARAFQRLLKDEGFLR